MPTRHEADEELYPADAPISVSHLFHTIGRYSGVILISLAGVAVAYLIVAAAILLTAPTQTVTSLPFRLEFKGASAGQYPNGLKFSTSDITATPVLLDVFGTNEISRFTNFDQFARSIVILESNRELERLTEEYQAKLADPKLTPVDRDRIEREFEAKRESISKSDYSIVFMPTASTKAIPSTVARKSLADVLAAWARRAAVEKKVLDYPVAALSTNALTNFSSASSGDLFVSLLLLRRRADDLLDNARAIEEIPGAPLIRTRSSRSSLSEVRLHLEEAIRFQIEPLISLARSAGIAGSSGAVEMIRGQLAYDQRLLDAAQARETALRNTLLTYESAQPSSTGERALTAGPRPSSETAPRGPETVMPQLSDTFLDRIVDLTSRGADREYRQKLADEIKKASLEVVPLQAAVKYDEQMLAAVQNAGGAGGAVAGEELQKRFDIAVGSLRTAVTELNEIYTAASRQLFPETELFRTIGPAVTRSERAVSIARLALGGILTLLIAIPVILVLVLLHNRVREEEAAEAAEARGTT